MRSGIAALVVAGSLALGACKAAERPTSAESPTAPGNALTVAAIYGEKSLGGSLPRGVKWSPDGKFVTFLRGGKEKSEILDLWAYDVAAGKASLLVAASELVVGEEKELSKEEAARRERKRITSKGIVEYFWSKKGSLLLFPLNGDLFVFDLKTRKTRQITNSEEGETDAKFSPDENYVSFIRKNEIYAVALAGGPEIQLTQGATERVWNGVAEFIAQEEMDRQTGYWWSPKSDRIAYTQIDHAQVPEFQVPDYSNKRGEGEKQFYPKAGDPNVTVKLGVLSLADKTTRWLDLCDDKDIYLPRVDWLPDGKRLSYQIENRVQNRLDLVVADLESGTIRNVLTESENEWIDLHDDLRFFQDGKRFLWSSERSGRRHLYLGNLDQHANGEGLVALTSGDWDVLSLAYLDEQNGTIIFSSNRKSPLERHLEIAAFGKTPRQLTQDAGWHAATVSPDGAAYIDLYSNCTRPPCLRISKIDANEFSYLEENKTPQLDQYHLQEPEFLQFTSEEGIQFNAKMIKPRDFDPSKKYPALVYVYGGPGSQTVRRAWDGDRELWHHSLAQQGVLVFSLDGRGTGSRGKSWMSTVFRNLGHYETLDQIAGAKYLASLPYVDGTRIGIWGWSYGGYMTCMSLFAEGTPFKLGIAVAPVTTWRNYDTHYTERYMGLPKDNEEGYEKSAPLAHAKNLKNRFLLVHGMADDNVHFQDSVQLIEKLQKAKLPFEMMLYPGKTHQIAGREARTHLFEKMTEFVLHNL